MPATVRRGVSARSVRRALAAAVSCRWRGCCRRRALRARPCRWRRACRDAGRSWRRPGRGVPCRCRQSAPWRSAREPRRLALVLQAARSPRPISTCMPPHSRAWLGQRPIPRHPITVGPVAAAVEGAALLASASPGSRRRPSGTARRRAGRTASSRRTRGSTCRTARSGQCAAASARRGCSAPRARRGGSSSASGRVSLCSG